MHQIRRRWTASGHLRFVFDEGVIEVNKDTRMYGDLMRWCSLVQMLGRRGENVIMMKNMNFNAELFRTLLRNMNNRQSMRLHELYDVSLMIGYLGFDNEIVKQLMPIHEITWRDIKYCLPALYRFLGQGYKEIVKIIFANCGYPSSFCESGIHLGYHKFVKRLRNYRRMENYKKSIRTGYTYPYINELQIRQSFRGNYNRN